MHPAFLLYLNHSSLQHYLPPLFYTHNNRHVKKVTLRESDRPKVTQSFYRERAGIQTCSHRFKSDTLTTASSSLGETI